MSTLSLTAADVALGDDNTAWVFYVNEIRASSTGGVTSTKKVRKYPVDGVLTVELDPGPAVVIAADGKHYPFVVPEADAELWPLIQAAVAIPPLTTQEKLNAAVETWLAGPAGGIPVSGLTDLAANRYPLLTGDAAAARGAIGAVGASELAAATGLTDVTTPQGIGEYGWILPASLYLPEPYRHTLHAKLGNSDGTNTKVLLTDLSHESNNAQTYEIASVPADDHNSPAVITAPGDPIVMQWTWHGLDNLIRIKVGLPDRPDSLVTATEQTFDMGAITAYGQWWKVNSLSNDTQVTYYMLYRRNLIDWYLLTVSVNRTTLIATATGPGVQLYSSTGLQCYLTNQPASSDGQVRNIICGTSPASEPDWVLYFRLDSATGAITTPLDGTFTANLNGTNLPITPSATKTQLLPSLSGAQAAYERRMLAVRPGMGIPAVLTAEGDPNDRSSTSRYWWHEYSGNHTAPTTGAPTADSGLICPTGSPTYVKGTNPTLANAATSIKVTTKVKLPASKPSVDWLDICGQLNDAASDSGWQLWLGATVNELRPRLIVNRAGNTAQTLSATSALAGVTWGSEVWIRCTYTIASSGSPARRCTIESSPDGSTWTEIGAIAGNSGALAVASDAYTWIGARALARSYGLVIKTAKIEISGVTKVDLDFTNDSTGWPGYTSAYTDALSNAWSLLGAGSVGRTAYGPPVPSVAIANSYDLGLTGGNFGYASYYPGAAFVGAASAMLARTNGANQELVLTDVTNGVVHQKVLRTQLTTQGRFARPMPPANGGPLHCWLMNVTDYGSNEFYDWESSTIAVRRL